jgi:hypothetical protein
MKFKMAICWHYKTHGVCAYGDACAFAHGSHELRHNSKKYKTRLCNTWMAGHECSYGDACAFAHGAIELRGGGGGLLRPPYPPAAAIPAAVGMGEGVEALLGGKKTHWSLFDSDVFGVFLLTDVMHKLACECT